MTISDLYEAAKNQISPEEFARRHASDLKGFKAKAKPRAKPEAEAEPKPEAKPEPDYGPRIKELAALDPIAYGRARAEAAAGLGVGVGFLDEAVAAERAKSGLAKVGQGKKLVLTDPEPWPEAVDGAELLDAIDAAFARHIVMDDNDRLAVTLWCVFTWLIDHLDFAPRLMIKSPEKRCGKSTLMALTGKIVRHPLPASSITASAVFRVIEANAPTLLLDEADTFLPENEPLRGVLNSGHGRDGAFTVLNVQVGDEWEPRAFSTWAAVAVAGIGGQHGTLEDRSIIVRLRRKLTSEKTAKMDRAAIAAWKELARKCCRWSADHGRTIAALHPVVPEELNDRAADNWAGLLAIADRAGGRWPAVARAAATDAASVEEAQSARVLLLGDLKDIFARRYAKWIEGASILEDLNAMAERPWPQWSKGRPMTAHALGRMLSEFGISSTHNRERTKRGYDRESLSDAFERYLTPSLSPQGGLKASRVSDAESIKGKSDFSKRPQKKQLDALRTATSPTDTEDRTHWTLRDPPVGKERVSDSAASVFDRVRRAGGVPVPSNATIDASTVWRADFAIPPSPELAAELEELGWDITVDGRVAGGS